MKEKLLIVDADANSRTDLAQMLQLQGYDEHGEQAKA